MKILIILRVALRSLRRTLLRSSLTALGIIIGVASVIAMVSLGNGAKAQVEEMFASMDSNRLSLDAQPPENLWRNGPRRRLPASEGLNLEDYAAIRNEIPGLAAVSVEVRSGVVGAIQANGQTSELQLSGMDVQGLQLDSRKIVSGAFFGEADVANAASVCLITEYLAQRLFSTADVVGRWVRLKDIPFTIIGVMADSDSTHGRMMGEQGGDTTVIIPYSSIMRRLDRNARISITMKAEDPARLGLIQQAVTDLMEQRRGKRTAQFITGNIAEVLETFKESSRTMTLLLGAIGGISLLVGGIGIMNIMLVSVTERTREIGIRMAIGTRGRDVLRQFLIEAVILSLLGGMIGIALGVGVAQLITHLNNWPTHVSMGSVLAAFLCAAGIGVFFGYFPARQAAQLDPIEALRAE